MSDLEMTRLCAEAMGLTQEPQGYETRAIKVRECWPAYDPLEDDAQAMALVKKMQLFIMPEFEGLAWNVSDKDDHEQFNCSDDDLNRAIVECVAKMQAARSTAGVESK